jgi:hypothetical protein
MNGPALGFTRTETDRAEAIFRAMGDRQELEVAMDLARFVRVPLEDAAMALCWPHRLRHLGFEIPAGASVEEAVAAVRPVVAGMAQAYSRTFDGRLAVREAQGNTLRRLLERILG